MARYEEGQIQRVLDAGPTAAGEFRLKVMGQGSAETNWLNITRDQLLTIFAMFNAEPDDTAGEQGANWADRFGAFTPFESADAYDERNRHFRNW